VIKHRKL